MKNTVDLHLHSTASDGTDTPAAIAALAKKHGLSAFALTDHDTVDGLLECSEAARRHGIAFVPGIEISARDDEAGDTHILGFGLDCKNAELLASLREMRASRDTRNETVIERLNALGIPLTIGDVLAFSGGGTVGRAHIAAALVAGGYVSDSNEAFDRYLMRGGEAYVPRFGVSPEDAIAIIRNAGGVAYIAHPHLLAVKGARLDSFVARLTAIGLRGLEAYYTGFGHTQTHEYSSLAAKHGLSISGGSDYHGANKPVKMGEANVPAWVMDTLL